MGKILPILLAFIGLGAGVGAGIALRPEPAPMDETVCAEPTQDHGDMADELPDPVDPETEITDFVKLNNQFVIPVVSDGSVAALVVLALSIEISTGGPELIYKYEPKLRDAFLQVMFDHANTGGFDGNFTTGHNMDQLRKALLESAQKILGSDVTDILIVDIVRQDT